MQPAMCTRRCMVTHQKHLQMQPAMCTRRCMVAYQERLPHQTEPLWIRIPHFMVRSIVLVMHHTWSILKKDKYKEMKNTKGSRASMCVCSHTHTHTDTTYKHTHTYTQPDRWGRCVFIFGILKSGELEKDCLSGSVFWVETDRKKNTGWFVLKWRSIC